jgi:hypothetical protein
MTNGSEIEKRGGQNLWVICVHKTPT